VDHARSAATDPVMTSPADAALAFDPVDGATMLHAIPKPGYAEWLAAQSAAVRDWLDTTRFRAEVGDLTWLPGRSVLAITSADALYAIADLPLKLPPGDYALASATSELNVLGWGLGAYQFTRYKAAARAPARLVVPQHCQRDRLRATVESIYLVRDLINTPASDMLPDQLADAAIELARQFNARCDVTVGDDLLAQNHPTIHAVGRASGSAPRLIDLQWGDAADPKLTLIGKGVCFDSGGLDIKPANGMRLMKKDMGGAAHVLGLARLVMALGLPVRLRVLIPAVENAIAGNAFRPGDVIRTRRGITVEIDNTDAEGRLVLCDALALACEEDPALIVDFATLTGAARTALGTDLPALFANDDMLADGLVQAGRVEADPLWRLPLHQPYRKLLDSKTAEIANSSSQPYAGAITAALFLETFVKPGVAWAHFDLMAWNTASQPGRPEGGEAMALRAVYAHLVERFQRRA
jgi:leucyl aminopeptidase